MQKAQNSLCNDQRQNIFEVPKIAFAQMLQTNKK